MNFKDILLYQEVTKNYKIDHSKYDSLKTITDDEVNIFFNNLIEQYIEGDDFTIQNIKDNKNIESAEEAMVNTFCQSLKDEWDSSKANLEELKKIMIKW